MKILPNWRSVTILKPGCADRNQQTGVAVLAGVVAQSDGKLINRVSQVGVRLLVVCNRAAETWRASCCG